MKQISLIIPNTQSSVQAYENISPAEQITSVVQNIHENMDDLDVDYEIIIVTDSLIDISLRDIEVFPRRVPIRLYREKHQKSVSELSIRGIAFAQYDYIGIVGGVNEFSTQIIQKIAEDKDFEREVVASINVSYSQFIPFSLKMRISPQNAALFFPKKVWDIIHFKPATDNTFFLELLKRAQETGFPFKKYQTSSIQKQTKPFSKHAFKKISWAVKDVLSVYLAKVPPILIPAQKGRSMLNAGLFYKKHRYITHTTLDVYQSALEAVDKQAILVLISIVVLLVIALFVNSLLFIQSFIAVLSCIYVIDVCFNMFLVFKSFQSAPELSFTPDELAEIKEGDLPTYSILCPLYKEAHILPQFIEGLEKIEWPKDKLDVIILLESDDKVSIKAFDEMQIPSYIRSVIVPNSIPKTKPKACNYGLAFVKGEYTVIYDAEDLPDPLQLKKAYLGFQKSGKNVACLQAKLNYYNANQNLLTRFFTAEYSLWFDITLTSLHALNTIIPLGGTSNHFRTNDLKKLHAWDPFNVTEDADLGMRLFKLGYTTAILDSVTLEEGNSQFKNWIRQRSRWIKGYMQTYLVHTKESYTFFRERGLHALVFHLVIGGKLAFIIINPILWIVTLLYFTLYSVVGPTIDSLYPSFVLYVAMSSLIFGNALYLFCYIIGCIKKEQWSLIKYMYLIPFYWIMISIAGFLALYQLIFKPFYWEKTVHGLHLKNRLSLTQAIT
jgi:cellulose synthase/poly-beta-1,6-N-acetylglucosamine synthase-like glycosyltransferase